MANQPDKIIYVKPVSHLYSSYCEVRAESLAIRQHARFSAKRVYSQNKTLNVIKRSRLLLQEFHNQQQLPNKMERRQLLQFFLQIS